MKIIGKSSRDGAYSSEFIVNISEDELRRLLGYYYSASPGAPRLSVGDVLDPTKMIDMAQEMRDLKEKLAKTPQTLRALADIIDRECDPITKAPSPEQKGEE